MRLDQSVQSIGDTRLRMSQEDAEYTSFKIEQRKLMEEKVQAQKRIESLKREYDFIFKLKPSEVNDVLMKKAEYAAIRIQRNFRERRQRRLLIEQQRHGYILDLEPEKTEAELKALREEKERLERKRQRLHQEHRDYFLDDITEEQRKDLRERLQAIWRHSRSGEGYDYYDSVHESYVPRNMQFNEAYRANELRRLDAHQKLIESEIMVDYLKIISDQELEEAKKPSTIGDTKIEVEQNEHLAATKAEKRIRGIRQWGELNEEITRDVLNDARKAHRDKLENYRKRKDWEALIEEDEIDMEGDRLLSEIKNYKSEHAYNTAFYS